MLGQEGVFFQQLKARGLQVVLGKSGLGGCSALGFGLCCLKVLIVSANTDADALILHGVTIHVFVAVVLRSNLRRAAVGERTRNLHAKYQARLLPGDALMGSANAAWPVIAARVLFSLAAAQPLRNRPTNRRKTRTQADQLPTAGQGTAAGGKLWPASKCGVRKASKFSCTI